MKIVDAKRKGKTITVPEVEERRAPDDLMAALEESLSAAVGKARAAPKSAQGPESRHQAAHEGCEEPHEGQVAQQVLSRGAMLRATVADLEEYRAKRRKGKTPEPLDGDAKKSSKKLVFVVQRHSARALHYDLRLERDGVLLSWALPRGVPLRAGERVAGGARRGPPARLRRLRGRHPGAASTAAARWRCGIAAPTSSQRERPDGTLTVILHGKKLHGRVGARARAPGRRGAQLADRARGQGRRSRAGAGVRADASRARPSASRAGRPGRSSSPGRACAPWRRSRARAAGFQHDGGDALDARCKRRARRACRARCARATASWTA